MSRGMSSPSQWRNHPVGDTRSSVRPTPTWSIQRKKARVKSVKPLKKKHSVMCALKGPPPRIRPRPLLRVEKPLRRLKLTWSLSAGKSIPRQAERIPAGNYTLASVVLTQVHQRDVSRLPPTHQTIVKNKGTSCSWVLHNTVAADFLKTELQMVREEDRDTL